MKIAGSGSACGYGSGSESGSISQRHGSADSEPLPHQNVMDPEHCLPPCQKYQCSIHIGVGSLAIADLSLTVLWKYNIRLGWACYHAGPGEYQCSAHNGVGSLAIADLSLTVLCEYNIHLGWSVLPVFRIRIQIRIHRIHMFLGLLDPDLDPLVRGMDPDPDPDPSIIKKKL
jgi:hypothetical protein